MAVFVRAAQNCTAGTASRVRTVARHRPTLAGGFGGDIEEGLGVEAELAGDRHAATALLLAQAKLTKNSDGVP